MSDKKLLLSFGTESSRSGAPLEWWYFHGCLQEDETIYFMLCVFRNRMERANELSKHGYTAIFSLMNDDKSLYRSASWVDPDFYSYYIDNKEIALRTEINSQLVEAIFYEYKISGPPEPIKINYSPILFKRDPFEFHWDTIHIVQNPDYLLLSFSDPKDGTPHDLKIIPRSPHLEPKHTINLPSGQGMSYLCYPDNDLAIVGGQQPVSATAWFDHQWGDYSWLVRNDEQHSVLGWDWLGINLEDGSEIIVIVHREMPGLHPIGAYALIRNQDREILETHDVVIKPQRYWLSPKTGILYPVAMLVLIPELKAEFQFTPVTDNQEIPVFGLQRAVWQGAGNVSGQIDNKSIIGTARGELNGYGYLFKLDDYLKHQAEKIDPIIESFFPKIIREEHLQSYAGKAEGEYFPSAVSEFLAEPVWDLLSRKGKRWRPIFTQLLMGALGKDSGPYEAMLYCLAELVHTGSLIIDDIEDASLLRRGEEAIHIRYGQDLAINAANTLYFLPITLLFEHPALDEKQKLEIYQLMTRQYIRAHLGQGQDLYFTRNMNPHNLDKWMNDSLEPKLFQTYSLKTGAPLQGLAETAAIIARAGQECRKACGSFASAFGVTFQIIDDIHNFSHSPNWTKTSGEDLTEGKMTYVIYESLKNAPENDRIKLYNILTSKELRKDPDLIQEGVSIIMESGSLDICREKARSIIRPAWESVSVYLQPTEQRLLLKLLTIHLVDMDLEK
ncbi:MAG: polyprenyl synthetase family protein [Bacteroidales bacterium]